MRAGYREVTATEALYRLDPSLSFTSSTFGQVVRVSAYLGARGQVAATADKLRYSARPATLCHLSLCQFLMYYRVARAEEQGRAAGGFDNSLDISQIEREAAEGQEVGVDQHRHHHQHNHPRGGHLSRSPSPVW